MQSIPFNGLASGPQPGSRSGNRRIIGLLAPEIGGWRKNSFLTGVLQAAAASDVDVFCFLGERLNPFNPLQPSFYDLAITPHLSGLLVSGSLLHGFAAGDLQAFYERFAPCPVVGVLMALDGYPAVLADGYQGMRSAVEHLVQDHGLQRIAFIRGPQGELDADQRFQAYCDVLEANDIPLDPDLVIPGYFRREDGTVAMQRLLERSLPVQAVVSANDAMALGALDVLQAAGKRVPQDIALVGFDDVNEARHAPISLTTVRQSFFECGQQAVYTLVSAMDGESVPEVTLLPTELIIRRSCGCLPPSIQRAQIKESILASQTGPLPATAGQESPTRVAISALNSHSDSILNSLQRAIQSEFASVNVTIQLPELERIITRGWQALLHDLQDPEGLELLAVMEEAGHQIWKAGGDVFLLQEALSTLNNMILPFLRHAPIVLRLQNLIQQARLLVSETSQRQQAYQRLLIDRKEQTLQDLEKRMSVIMELGDLAGLVEQGFPQVGIGCSYLALYDSKPDSRGRVRIPSANARLVLAQDEHGVQAPTQTFDTQAIVPFDRLDEDEQVAFAITPLSLGAKQLGYWAVQLGPEFYSAGPGNTSQPSMGTDWEVIARLHDPLASVMLRSQLIQQQVWAQEEVERLFLQAQDQAEELRDANQVLSRRAGELELSSQLGQRITSILALDELLPAVVQLIQQKFGYYFVSIWLADSIWTVNRPNQKVQLSAGYGRDGAVGFPDNFFIPLDAPKSVVALVTRTGEFYLSNDTRTDPQYLELPELPETASELGLPLRIGPRVIGALDVQSEFPAAFDIESHTLLELLANQIAIAIRNAQLYQVQMQRRALAESLEQTGRILSSILDINTVPHQVLAQLARLMPFERGALLLKNGGGADNLLSVAAYHGYADESAAAVLPLEPATMLARLEALRRPWIVDNMLAFIATSYAGGGAPDVPAGSWMSVPLISQDTVIGLLTVGRSEVGAFNQDDATWVSAFAGQSAIALENARLYGEIKQFSQHLESMVQVRTEELKRAYETLEKLDQTKADFIEVAAHELRTPLTLIKGYAALLEPMTQNFPDAKPLLEGIQSGERRLLEVVNSMLDVSKIDSQVLQVMRKPITVGPLLRKMEHSFKDALLERRLTLTVKDVDNLPILQADAELLYKVFYQIGVNAIKYTPDGGWIDVMACERLDPLGRPGIEITFTDSGIGIDPSHHELVFEKFFQTGKISVHSSGKFKFKGAGPGLGLAIAQGIVVAHGGRIWAESQGHDEEQYPGSTFHVWLPLQADPVTPAA